MNVMNGLIAVGVAIAGLALILICTALMNRWPAETFVVIVTALVLAIIFMLGAYA